MRKAWKKAVSVLLTLVLIFGVLPAMNVSAEGEGGQGSRSIELNFAGTVNGSIVTYGVEGTDVALTVEGAELNDSKVSISEGNLGSLLQYAGFGALTKEMADAFIEKIEISNEKAINIYWKFNKSDGSISNSVTTILQHPSADEAIM